MNSSTIARVNRTLMGVKCTVTVVGSDSPVVAQRCLDAIADFEHLWSRFIPTSDISRLNAADGEPVWVNDKTIQLVAFLQAAHEETGGLFNPTLLPLQMVAGDDHSLVDEKTTVLNHDAVAQAGMSGISILDDGRVQLLNGTTLDAGGLAKGFTADLVVQQALAMGATGACVNIGGDMFIHTGSAEAWPVDIMSPDNSHVVDSVLVSHGGVATSTLNARHRNGAGITNHIFTIDGPTTSHTVSATVIASHAAWAEAWTKYAIVAPTDEVLHTIASRGMAAMLVLADGTTVSTDSWKELRQ